MKSTDEERVASLSDNVRKAFVCAVEFKDLAAQMLATFQVPANAESLYGGKDGDALRFMVDSWQQQYDAIEGKMP